MRNVCARAALAAAVFLGVSVHALHGQSGSPSNPDVSIMDLGVLPGAPGGSSARAINNSGVVVGESSVFKPPIFSCGAAFDFHAFHWSGETGMQDLGVLPNGCNSLANAISDTGFIVGYSQELFGLLTPRNLATIWTPGASSPTALGFPPVAECQGQTQVPPFSCSSNASGINPNGETVVGGTGFGPFTWNPTTGMQLLGVSNQFAVYGMNSLGVVACSHPTVNGLQACLLKPDGTVIDLPLNGQFCEAFAVNDSNEAAGYCEPPSGTPDIAMFWGKNGVAQAIGINGFGQAIDSQGEIVGEGEDAPGLAFLWSKSSGVTLLSSLLPADSGWTLANAYAINDRGQIVGDGVHNGQSRAFLLNLTACINAGGDTDGDGLCDDWEKNGLTINVNGTPVFLDLPAMGADPNHKDVFVQVDTVGLNAVIAQISLGVAITAFARAPVSNPDGFTGITLHVDNGPDSIMDPRTGATWGALSKKSFLLDVANLGNLGPGGGCDGFPNLFDVEKKLHFPPERVPVFHYAISELGPILEADGKTPGADGIARCIPSSDFIVAPKQGSDDGYVAYVFMHELGHNLGLGHGGGDNINGKPNYLSIMNYNFSNGLMPADPNLAPVYDYSRFGAEPAPLDPDSSDPANRLPVLDEDHLNETTGLGTPDFPVGKNVLAYVSLRQCGPGGLFVSIEHLNQPIDWDCDGPPDTKTDVPVDVNGDGELTLLTPYDDWGNLIFNGGQIGGLAKPPSPQARIFIEPTPDQVQKVRDFWAAQRQQDKIPPVTTASPSPQPNAAGWNNSNVTVTLTSTDNEPGGSGVKQITYSATGAQAIASTVVNGSTASFSISTEGITTITFFGTDNADNVESAKTLTIQLDKTPPSINCGAPDGLWHATDVTIACTASDAGSGLANASDASLS